MLWNSAKCCIKSGASLLAGFFVQVDSTQCNAAMGSNFNTRDSSNFLLKQSHAKNEIKEESPLQLLWSLKGKYSCSTSCRISFMHSTYMEMGFLLLIDFEMLDLTTIGCIENTSASQIWLSTTTLLKELLLTFNEMKSAVFFKLPGLIIAHSLTPE